MRKKLFCRIAGVLTTCIILSALLSYLTILTTYKENYNGKSSFMDKANDCDVLFLGNSRARDAIFPMELWGEYGIASYNLAFPGTTVQTSYWVLMNALDYTQPQLVVVDCSSFSANAESALPYVQSAMVAFPLSFTKIRMALDIYPVGMFSFDDMFSVIWPFSKFHNRWSELEADDFYREENYTLGAVECIGSAEPQVDDLSPAVTDYTQLETNVEYMQKIAQACKQRGIQLVFCHLPFPATNTEKWEACVAEKTAEELNVEFINFLETDTVDYSVDMFDSASHLNSSGGRKISNYLGSFLAEKYGLADHRNDERFESWENEYQIYLKDRKDSLAKQTMLNNSLLYLSYEKYSSVISIPAESKLYEDEKAMRLLENMAGGTLPGLKEAALGSKDYMLFVDRAENCVYETVYENYVKHPEYGEIRTNFDVAMLYIGSAEFALACETEISGISDVQIFVFTDEMDHLKECSHSFMLSEEGIFERTDY